MADSVTQQSQDQGLGQWLYNTKQSPSTQATVDSHGSAGAQQAAPVSMGTVGRTVVGLAIIIAVILVCMWFLKRFGPYRRLSGKTVKLVSGQSVGPRERIVVVEVEDQWLVLGVTQHNVNLLHKLPAATDTPPESDTTRRPNDPPTFTQALADNLRQMVSRSPRS